MQKLKYIFGVVLLMSIINIAECKAQDHYIQGKVTNITDGDRPFRVGTVNLYFAKSRKEANQMAKNLTKDHHYYDLKMQETTIVQPDENGYYVCEQAYADGYIVVDVGTEKCPIYEIKGITDLNLQIAVEGEMLEGVTIEAKMPDSPVLEPTAPTLIGDQMFFSPQFASSGRNDERIVYQTYVTTCFQKQDSIVRYFPPIVLEGSQFSLTQERRMGYTSERDPLSPYVEPTPLGDEYTTFSRDFHFTMPDPMGYYQLKMSMVKQHYTGIIEQIDTVACKCQREDPLHFFQYTFDTYPLEPLKYRPSSQLRTRNDADTVSLTFIVGKAQLDPNNSDNTTEWNKIVEKLVEIREMKGSRIQSFEIVGVSSPEGSYQTNKDLADKRANYALQRLISQGLLQRNTKLSSKGEVAEWAQVADLMQKEHPEKAQEILNIVTRYNNRDTQSARIRKLPYYPLIKEQYLPQLRSVRTSCNYMVRRNLKTHEVVEIYQKDPSFKFEPLEYWMLIQATADAQEKIKICKRALRENTYDTPLRPYAANELARTYMSLGMVDTLLLQEFIIPQYRVNQKIKISESYTKIYNPDALIANQVCMYLSGKHYFSAASLMRRLEDIPEYLQLSQLVACLNGYYADNPTILNAMLGENLINTIVLHLAMGAKQNKHKVPATQQRYHNVEALKLIRQLNYLPKEKQALGYYFKAVIYHRLNMVISEAVGLPFGPFYEEKAEACLLKCFELNEEFIDICKGDAYIRDIYDENDMRDIYEAALTNYYKWKDHGEELNYDYLDDNDPFSSDPTPEEVDEWKLCN